MSIGAAPRAPTSLCDKNDQSIESDILGIAAGGKMYGARNCQTAFPFIVFFNRVQKIYRDENSPRVQLCVLL